MSKQSHHRRSRPTHRQAGKVRWCSFLWIATALAFFTAFSTIGYGIFSRDMAIVKPGLAIGGFAIVLWITSLLSSTGLNCSICANPVYSSRPCKKHARASRFLGFSYRLGIAVPALFTGKFRCMYCGEKMTLSATKATQEKAPAIKPHSDRPICHPNSLPAVRSKEELQGPSATIQK